MARTAPAYMAVGIVSAISEALLTAMKVAVKSYQYGTDMVSYVGIIQGIIDEIL